MMKEKFHPKILLKYFKLEKKISQKKEQKLEI